MSVSWYQHQNLLFENTFPFLISCAWNDKSQQCWGLVGLFGGRHYLEWTWWLVRALDTTSSRHGEPWLPLIGSNSFRFTTYIIIIFIILIIFINIIDIIIIRGPKLTLIYLNMQSFKERAIALASFYFLFREVLKSLSVQKYCFLIWTVLLTSPNST